MSERRPRLAGVWQVVRLGLTDHYAVPLTTKEPALVSALALVAHYVCSGRARLSERRLTGIPVAARVLCEAIPHVEVCREVAESLARSVSAVRPRRRRGEAGEEGSGEAVDEAVGEVACRALGEAVAACGGKPPGDRALCLATLLAVVAAALSEPEDLGIALSRELGSAEDGGGA